MRAGDFLVYGNGRKVEIVNFPKISGEPGVQLKDPEAMFFCDTFKTKEEVDKWVSLGVWKIEYSERETGQ